MDRRESQSLVKLAGNSSAVDEGLKATLRLVVDPALENVTGEFFDVLSLAKANAQAYEKPVQQRLAAHSQQLVSIYGAE